MKGFRKYTCIFVYFLFLLSKLHSQDSIFVGQHAFVNYVATVKMTPAEFLLIPTLTITSKTEIIEVQKSRYFVEGSCYLGLPLVSGQIFLEREVQNSYVNITTNSFRHRPYDPNYETMQNVDYSHPICDTVNLGLLYPFEPGKYRISVEIYYFHNKQQHTARSNFFDFDVTYLPKISLFK